jgi:hypothetical protein
MVFMIFSPFVLFDFVWVLFLCKTVRSESTHLHRGAMPCLRFAWKRNSHASTCLASPLPRLVLLRLCCDALCRRFAVLRSAMLRFAVASHSVQRLAFLRLRGVMSRTALPLRYFAFQAFAEQGIGLQTLPRLHFA